MLATQVNAYHQTNRATLSGRDLESAVLTKAALLLKQCQDGWNEPDRDAKLNEALRFNQKLWSVLQDDLSRPDNPLPKKMREDILSLSIFIDKRIFEVMAYPSPEKLSILVSINLNLAAGLRTSQEG